MARKGRPTDKPLTPFGSRLRAAIGRVYETRTAFTLEARIAPQVLYRYEDGRQSPRLVDVERWAALLHVSPEWLAFGAGPQDNEATTPELERAAVDAGLGPDGLRALSTVRSTLGKMTRGELAMVAEILARNIAH